MAIKVTKEVVCDFGDRHSGDIRNWRVTIEGESKVFDLCPTCSKPLTRLWGRGPTARAAPKRMVIASMSEIEAAKKK